MGWQMPREGLLKDVATLPRTLLKTGIKRSPQQAWRLRWLYYIRVAK
jgi:hypothetical protein